MRLFGVDPTNIEERHTAEDLKQIIDSSRVGRHPRPRRGGDARRRLPPARAGGARGDDADPGGGHVDSTDTVETALRRCVSSGHTRLVVIEDDNPDRVKGIVHNNSLARLYMNDGPEASIEPAIRDA